MKVLQTEIYVSENKTWQWLFHKVFVATCRNKNTMHVGAYWIVMPERLCSLIPLILYNRLENQELLLFQLCRWVGDAYALPRAQGPSVDHPRPEAGSDTMHQSRIPRALSSSCLVPGKPKQNWPDGKGPVQTGPHLLLGAAQAVLWQCWKRLIPWAGHKEVLVLVWAPSKRGAPLLLTETPSTRIDFNSANGMMNSASMYIHWTGPTKQYTVAWALY